MNFQYVSFLVTYPSRELPKITAEIFEGFTAAGRAAHRPFRHRFGLIGNPMAHFLPTHVRDLAIAATQDFADLGLAAADPAFRSVRAACHQPDAIFREMREDGIDVMPVEAVLDLVEQFLL